MTPIALARSVCVHSRDSLAKVIAAGFKALTDPPMLRDLPSNPVRSLPKRFNLLVPSVKAWRAIQKRLLDPIRLVVNGDVLNELAEVNPLANQ